MESKIQHRDSLEKYRKEIMELRENLQFHKDRVIDLEELLKTQRRLIASVDKEKEMLHEMIKELETKLSGFTKAQLVRPLTQAERGIAYSYATFVKSDD